MVYIVYETINLINNKKYIGVYKTLDPKKFDGYYGSGCLIKSAIRKYGKTNFFRRILYSFEDEKDAFIKEEELITNDIINSSEYYNIAPGGNGGDKISYIRKDEKKILYDQIAKKRRGKKDSDLVKLKKKIAANKRIIDHPHTIPNNKGRKHLGEKLNNILEGIKNTHSGSKFISNGLVEIKISGNMHIVLEKDWYFGRSKKMREFSMNRLHTDISRKKIKESSTGMLCYNNGIENIRIKKGNKIPDGFNRGMIKRKKDEIRKI